MTAAESPPPRAPSPWLVRCAPLLPPAGGSAVDLACGNGRNTGFLLARGLLVTAVDRAPSAPAERRGAPGLRLVTADLETDRWPLAGRSFDAVVVSRYLWRPRLPEVLDLIAPGGVLIYETFADGHQQLAHPRRPEFLLRRGELLEHLARREMTVVAYEHGRRPEPEGGPAVVQRVCAVRRLAGSPPPRIPLGATVGSTLVATPHTDDRGGNPPVRRAPLEPPPDAP